MTARVRLAVVLALSAVLSIGVLAAGEKLTPATAAIQIRLADVLYDHADYQSAMHLYLRATGCEEQGIRDRARAGTIRSALRIAEYGVAATQMQALKASAPNDSAMLTLAADALWASGRFDEAESAYRDALALNAVDARARHGVAKSLASKNRLDMAVDEVQAALRIAPNDADLYQTLGSIYERMHRFPEAASAYATFLGVVKGAQRSDRTRWARLHIDFLRSFGRAVPYDIAPSERARRHVIDFRLVNGKVMIKAKVNGRSVIEFALDTGAERSTVSERTARRLNLRSWTETLSAGVGLAGLRGLAIGKLDSLEIGSLTVRNIPCLIKSPVLQGLAIDQMNGFSPLDLGLPVGVDYKAKRLTIGELPVEGGRVRELPLRMNRLATVRGDVNGNPVSFIVDTGGETISLGASTARTLFTPADRRRIKLNVYGASGPDPDAYLLPGVNLAFGSLILDNQPVVVLDLRAPSVLLGYEIGGIIGYRFLGKYRVEFDLERSVLRLRDL